MKIPSYDDYVEYCKQKNISPIHEIVHIKRSIIEPVVNVIIIWSFNRGIKATIIAKRNEGH